MTTTRGKIEKVYIKGIKYGIQESASSTTCEAMSTPISSRT
jgi:hypothetical protein